jgi:hypothetical protein
MSFSKQRFVLGLLFALMPMIYLAALLQNPQVSVLVMNLSLRIARLQTGLKVNATGWSVSPLLFRASMQNFSVQWEGVNIRSKSLSVQVSPVYLLVGRLYLGELNMTGTRVFGSLPESWFRSDSNSQVSAKDIADAPDRMGRALARLSSAASRRNLVFELLSLSDFQINTPQVEVRVDSLLVENFEAGQLRVSWDLGPLKVPGRLATLHQSRGTLSLLRERRQDFVISISRAEIVPDPESLTRVELVGRLPGEIRVQGQSDLKSLGLWMNESLREDFLKRNKVDGRMKWDQSLRISASGDWDLRGSLSWSLAAFDVYRMKSVEAEVFHSPSKTEIKNLNLVLPDALGSRSTAANRVLGDSIVYQDARLRVQARLDQVQLCSILEATDVPECYAGLGVSGSIQGEGRTEPFDLPLKLMLSSAETTPVWPETRKENPSAAPLLWAKPLQIQGQVSLRAKDMTVDAVELRFGTSGRVAKLQGPIQYKPTTVDLKLESSEFYLQEALDSFLDLKWNGGGATVAQILYNRDWTREEGRTKVFSRVDWKGVGVEGYDFVDATGPLQYNNREFQIGNLKLSRGGGRGDLRGRLFETPRGSRLELIADLDRIEIEAKTPESGTEIFKGFLSGRSEFKGQLKKGESEFFSGSMELRMGGFRSFGVPFQRGTAVARYQNRVLYFDRVQGWRDGSSVEMDGVLNPDGGSELRFRSNDFPVQELGYTAKYPAIHGGRIQNFVGFWKPASGWELRGDLIQLRLGGVQLNPGWMKLSGNAEQFMVDGEISGLGKLSYSSHASDFSKTRLQVALEDLGVYSAMAFLKGWTTRTSFQTQGRLSLDWTPNEGRFDIGPLVISAEQSRNQSALELLKVSGAQSFHWNGRRVVKNSIQVEGPSQIRFIANPGDEVVGLELGLPVLLLEGFVPGFQLLGGRMSWTGQMPLPPDLNTVVASGSVEDASFRIAALGNPLTSLRAQLGFARRSLSFEQATGRMGTGDLRASGVYRVDLEKPGITLAATLNRASAVILDDVPFDATGQIQLRGEERPYLATGKLQISNALYSKEFSVQSAVVDRSLGPLLNYDLEVELQNNVFVRNSLANTSVSGRMFLKGTDLDPDFRGELVLKSGSLFANENEFRVSQGSVLFPGGVPPNPVLNIQAQTTVRAPSQNYIIDLRARGPVRTLALELSSDPALATPDIVNLLAFGTLRGDEDLAVGASGDLIGAARAEAFQILFGKALGQNINKTTGFDIRFRASPDLARKEFIPKVQVMRKLTDRVTATFGRSLDINKPERNFQIDYRLLNNVNVTGVWESPTPEDSSLGVDLRFRFDVK